MSYVNYMSYVSYMSYVNYMSYVDYMSYVGRLYKTYELNEYFMNHLKSCKITWFLFSKVWFFFVNIKNYKNKNIERKYRNKMEKNPNIYSQKIVFWN